MSLSAGVLPDGGLLKRSLVIAGHRTSVSLEAAFWEALRQLALARGLSVQALVGRIDADRGEQNLSSAIRVFVLKAVWPSERPERATAERPPLD
ncbi:ribbon-helix-helix domain-containing protein [Methylobacterium currus]|uniref:ribbon-helix-helix domain-containing protein n=1 Tax=Methylobacterium currus TaxID=2051553 RepID=UPI001E647807|nr:ribbon-helix-helix domain-containing protein [Methylobacterium currus]UHC17741.1 ribbon-helix-helix domain-containing protein [Methylobacterium currus]